MKAIPVPTLSDPDDRDHHRLYLVIATSAEKTVRRVEERVGPDSHGRRLQPTTLAYSQSDPPVPSHLTVVQVAELLQVSRKTVYRWIRRREISFLKLPGLSYRIPRDAIDGFLHRADIGGPPPPPPDKIRLLAARRRASYRRSTIRAGKAKAP